MDLLADIHNWTRWVVLVAMVGTAVWGVTQAMRSASFDAGADRPFSLALILFDIQVALGLVLWIAGRMPPRVDHPWIMLVAVLVGHAALVMARRTSEDKGYRVAGLGFVVSLLLVAGGIPWGA